jgi:hypothetical protein
MDQIKLTNQVAFLFHFQKHLNAPKLFDWLTQVEKAKK